jgi:hypothetical protein
MKTTFHEGDCVVDAYAGLVARDDRLDEVAAVSCILLPQRNGRRKHLTPGMAEPGRHVRLMLPFETDLYSITSSARASSDAGMARLIALAVLTFTSNSKRAGRSTGMSAGRAPFRILST